MAGSNTIVCIEAGSTFIRLAELKGRGKKYRVLKTAEYRLPDGLVYDGYIYDMEGLSGIITEKLHESGIKTKKVIFSLISNKIISREVNIPVMKEKLVYEFVKNQAENYFPMDISDYVIAGSILDSSAENGQMHVMMYAAPGEIIESWLRLADVSGLEAVSIEYSGHAAYQYMKSRLSGEDTVLMLQIGETLTRASVISRGALAMQRNVNYGISGMQEALVGAGLVRDYDSAFELLEKNRYLERYLEGGAPGEAGAAGSDAAGAEALRQAATEAARQVISNVLRLIEYYTSQHREMPVQQIMLGDRGEYVKGLAELIYNETGIPVRTIEEWDESRIFAGELRQEHPGCFISACAAAFEPVDFRTDGGVRRGGADASRAAVLIVIGAVLICLLMMTVAGTRYAALHSQQQMLETQKSELQPAEEAYKAWLKADSINKEVNAIDASTGRMNEYLSYVFNELEQRLPQAAVITSMDSGGDVLTLSISAASQEAAAELLIQLKDMEYFSDVSISSLTDKTKSEAGGRVEFTVACTYDTALLDGTDRLQSADEAASEDQMIENQTEDGEGAALDE